MILVIAGNREEFNRFMKDVKGVDREKFKYIHSEKQLRGLDMRQVTELVRIGRYQLNPMIQSYELFNWLKEIEAKRGELT